MPELQPGDDVFEITHKTRMLDFQGGRLCCITDGGDGGRNACESFAGGGFDYNLKGVILRKPDGYQIGCRFVLKNGGYLRDYRCAPPNEWVSALRESRRIGIADPGGDVMLVCEDLWTGDIEGVLKAFYSEAGAGDGR